MRSIQEIFDKVIRAGLYDDFHQEPELYKTVEIDGEEYAAYPYMCNALASAECAGVITESERMLAQEAIDAYLDPTDRAYLINALYVNGLPNEFEDRLKIYNNWEKRPKLGYPQ